MRPILGAFCILMAGGILLAGAASAMDQGDLAQIQKAIEENDARWKAGDNPIFRLSREEQRRLCGAILEPSEPHRMRARIHPGPKTTPPESLDWRDYEGSNYITAITNQLNCGSCVGFGTVATLEAMINITRDRPGSGLDLSEQHVYSCGGGSCDFGWSTSDALDYLQLSGAPLESCLPYSAVDDNCDRGCSDWQDQARLILDWGTIPLGSLEVVAEEMKQHLMDGPLVVGITVFDDFFSYNGGIYEHVSGDAAGGHCISMVGWNDADSCWICKNSWGPSWGEDGFFRIKWFQNDVGIEELPRWLTPVPPTAYAQIVETNILDEVSGNGDGIPDPGESFDLTVSLSNPLTWATVTDVQGWMLSSDPRVSTLDVLANYPDLPDGGTTTNEDDVFSVIMTDQIGITPAYFTLFMTGTADGSRPYSQELVLEMPVTVVPSGWPTETTSGMRCSPMILWVGSGPRKVTAVEDNGTLHMWDHNGQEAPGFPFHTVGGTVWGSVATGDLDGDDRPEIVFGSKNDTLYALHHDGSLMFKQNMGADVLATPTIADFEGDGSPEIVLGTMDSELHILSVHGPKNANFPVVLGGSVMADAALADLDGNGNLDVVVGAADGLVYAIDAITGTSLSGFPVATGGAIWSSSAIADLDRDDSPEIIVGSDDRKLYVISSTGDILFTYSTGQPIRSAPAVADLNGDNYLDIIFTSQDGKVYAINRQGYSLSGWPYDTDKVLWNSPIVLDIDGDGALEVVLETPAPELLHLESDGTLLYSMSIDASGTVMSTPMAGDLDNDGDLEIAVGLPRGVGVWNYPTTSTVAMPWPMYRGNSRRTGNIDDNSTPVAESSPSPTTPVEYALHQNYPNPFNPETTIRYSLAHEGPVRLTIYNVLGQEILSLVHGHQQAGQHTVVWSGTNAAGNPVSSGLYFCRLEAGDFVQTRKMVLLK